MDKSKPTGPAQADKVEQAEQDRSPARSKDRERDKPTTDDQPGADGPNSAGANEDTYD